ncbi:MAG: putative toxin-antitoxin system toxin component, PIN family [Chitinophagales bacterium]
MQKIVIDTNVMVSAIIQKSFPYLIVNHLFIEQTIQLCISDELMAEYYEVLARPKFVRFQDFFIRAESLIAEIETKAVKYFPNNTLDLIKDDDDNRILELAGECEANFIITGNTNDFTMRNYKESKIVTPREYWENFQPK